MNPSESAARSAAAGLRTSGRIPRLIPGPDEDPAAWWRGEDSNLRRLSQQIYSLPRLTASVPLRSTREASARLEPPPRYSSKLEKSKSEKKRKQPPRHARHSLKPSWEAENGTLTARSRYEPSISRQTRAYLACPSPRFRYESLSLATVSESAASPGPPVWRSSSELARGLEPVTCGLQIRRSTS